MKTVATSFGHVSIMPRYVRQERALRWCSLAFGRTVAENVPERGARLLEEAIELAQAVGVTEDTALKLVRHVYSRPAGEVAQEVGGVSVTLLILCEQLRLQADSEEAKELARVMNKLEADSTHFAKRLNAKADAGVAIRADVET